MQLTVLGSGGIQPSLERSGPAYLVSAQGEHLLLDVGPGALRGLLAAGRLASDLTGVCVTHRHPDHCCELGLLIQLQKHLGRKAPLGLAGPAMLDDYLAFFASWGRAQPAWPPFAIERAVMPGEASWGAFDLSGLSVPHVEHSVGYRVQISGRTLVYPGDCGPSEAVVELARGADLLVLECSLPLGVEFDAHLNAEQAAEIAARAAVGKLVLSHFSPNVDPGQAQAICQQRGIETLAAADGMRIEI